jgi:fused signal recognition particle receptor
MSGLGAIVAVLVLAVLVFFFVMTVVMAHRSAQRRTEKISRELGIPLPDELPPLPGSLDDPIAVLDPAATTEPAAPSVEPRPRLRDRVAKTRGAISVGLRDLLGRGADPETWEELETSLLAADVGVGTTQSIIEELKSAAEAQGVSEGDALLALLRDQLVASLDAPRDLVIRSGAPTVWLFVGVNGAGKTTTIAKLARYQLDAGHSVLLAAADTFRAAAAEQLEQWGARVDVPVVRGQEGADPGSVVHDALDAASSRNTDLLLVDTAGRLHTKVNLMEELKKVRRVAERPPGHLTEVLLVLDATTGQNGLVQAREFADAVGVTGVVLTKLDGSAKGGIVLAIERELGIPVKLVGIGEGENDLVPFDPREFVDAVFDAS